jgi:hypothetical protein
MYEMEANELLSSYLIVKLNTSLIKLSASCDHPFKTKLNKTPSKGTLS